MSSHSEMRYSSRIPIIVWSQLSCLREGGKLLRGNGREKWSLAADQIHLPLHLHQHAIHEEKQRNKEFGGVLLYVSLRLFTRIIL